MKGISFSVLIKEARGLACTLLPCKDIKRIQPSMNQQAGLTRCKICLDLECLSFSETEKQIFLFISCLVYAILLQQPKWTRTEVTLNCLHLTFLIYKVGIILIATS